MNFTQANSRLMSMDQAGITSGNADIYILGSGGAADCIIIAGYAASSKQLILVHAMRQTNLEEVKSYIARLTEAKVYISSRAIKDQATSSLLSAVRHKFPNATEYDTGSLAIDARTAEVASEFNPSAVGRDEGILAIASKGSTGTFNAQDRQKYGVVKIPAYKKSENQKPQKEVSWTVGLDVEYYDRKMKPGAEKGATRYNEAP